MIVSKAVSQSPVKAASVTVLSNDPFFCTKPLIGIGSSTVVNGIGPLFIITQFTSTAESESISKTVPLFRVLTV